jgi:hypothetical protein
MNQDIQKFIRDYIKAIKESNAAIFAGAGLSKPAGFVNWKELLKEIAEDLGLDIDKEQDLISLAQYHVNENGRAKINELLLNEFTKGAQITENHKILARLPISTYWTTNYDSLIEKALESVGKIPDVKREAADLSITLRSRDAIVYKMHGDCTQPRNAVITRDDYDNYANTKRQAYTLTLMGDLLEKTFLFIGFSFDDPNLQQIISRIRALLEQDKRNHYCFMKRVSRDDYAEGESGEEEYRYAKVKQELKIKDLKRYGINVLLLDNYSQITDILRIIERQLNRENIFISGSASDFGDWGQQRVYDFAYKLGKSIIRKNYNIVSGVGLGVGSYVLSGALEEIYSNGKGGGIEHRLLLRPFPNVPDGENPPRELWTQYRQDMLSNVGIAVFIFGNKIDQTTGAILEADGVLEEFQIAVEKGAIPIPIGVTGFTTRKIWEEVMNNFSTYVPDESLKSLYEYIGDERNTDEDIIDTVIEIIDKLQKVGGL